MRIPSVSVIVPCYNSEEYVQSTIESVINQTFKGVELILIDDGSNDNTYSILKKYSHKAKIYSGQNRGASAARETGTRIAQGRFVQYLDADDLLRPTALERRIAALQSSGSDVAYSNYQRLVPDENGAFQPGPVERPILEEVHPDPEIATATTFWLPPAALTYRREIVEQIGEWHPNLPIIQDARFLQDAAYHGATFERVPEVLAEYRDHEEGSLSESDELAFRRDCLRNAQELEQRWRSDQDGSLTPEQRKHLSDMYERLAQNLFWDGESDLEKAVQGLHRTTNDLTRGKIYAGLSSLVGTDVARGVLQPVRDLLHLIRS